MNIFNLDMEPLLQYSTVMLHLSLATIIYSSWKEWGHYREISVWGLDLLTEWLRGQYIKASVWDFPVMTEQSRLISYLLYDLFIMDLSLQSIKTTKWSADNFKKPCHLNE